MNRLNRPTFTEMARMMFVRAAKPALSTIIAIALMWYGFALVDAARVSTDDARPPVILRYLGMQQAHPGAPFVLKARLRSATTNAPLQGHWVQFLVADRRVSALTNENGLASAVITLPAEAPPNVVKVIYLGPALDAASELLTTDATEFRTFAGLSITHSVNVASLLPATLTATLAPGQTISESKRALLPGAPQPADLVFSFDSNVGMSGFMAGVKGVAEDTMEALSSDGLDVRFAVVSHRDYPAAYQSFGYENAGGPVEYSPPGDFPYRLDQSLTFTKSQALAAISGIAAGTLPGDAPASYSRVLYESIAELVGNVNPDEGALGYRPEAIKLVALFGASTPHDNDLNQEIPSAVGADSTGGDPGRDGIMQEMSNPANIGVGNDDLDWQSVLDQMQEQGVSLLAMQLNPFDQQRWSHWAQRAGGELTLDYDQLQTAIRSRVFSGGEVGIVTLAVSGGYESWLTVTPTHYLSVPLPADLPFHVQLTPPMGTPPGEYHFAVDLVADGAVIASQSVSITVVAAPDLQLAKNDSIEGRIFPGAQISYTLHYTNAGNVEATGVVLTETVPLHTAFLPDASTPNWQCEQNGAAGALCTFPVGMLPPGAVGEVIFAVLVDAPLPPNATSIVNAASIGDDRGVGTDTSPTDNSDSVSAEVNHPPHAMNDAFVMNEDSVDVALNVLANDSDSNLDILTLTSVTQPAHGVAVIQSNTVRYTPQANFHGQDVFTYTVSDGALTDVASAAITVHPVNDPPSARDDAFVTDEDSVDVALDVLANDSDIDLDALTLTSVTQPAHGVAVIQSNTVRYTPQANFHGQDVFTYTVSDGALTDVASAAITVHPVNDPPSAKDDAFVVQEGSSANLLAVLANDQDIDGDTLTVVAMSAAAHGTATLAGGKVRYTPATSFAGADAFTYTVSDGQVQVSAKVAITVTPHPVSAYALAVRTLHTGDNSDGVITVGQLATATVAFTNTGEMTLTAATLAISFNPSVMTPADALPPPNQFGAGQLIWQNLVGPAGLAPGQHIHVRIVFRGVSSTSGLPGQAMAVQATANGVTDALGRPVAQKSAQDLVRVTRPALTLTSALSGSGNQPPPVGSLITFTVRLQNVGDTTITHAPLSEQYPSDILGFVRASVVGFAVSGDAGMGRIDWPDLTTQLGNIAPSQHLEILITYRVLTDFPVVSRQATVSGAHDQFGDELPTASAIVTIARAALQVSIAATPPTGAQVAPGSVVNYEIKLANSGGVTLTQLILDGLLAGDGSLTPLMLQTAGADAACPVASVQEPTAGRRVWTMPQLAPGVACAVALEGRVADTPQHGVMTLTVSALAAQFSQPVAAQSSHSVSPVSGVESFTATTSVAGIRLIWVTRSESGLTGFHLWRGATPNRSQAVRLTDTPIPTQGAPGSSYFYTEMPPLFDTTFYYWLEVIGGQGSLEFGPLGVNLPASAYIWLPLMHR